MGAHGSIGFRSPQPLDQLPDLCRCSVGNVQHASHLYGHGVRFGLVATGSALIDGNSAPEFALLHRQLMTQSQRLMSVLQIKVGCFFGMLVTSPV